MAIENWASPGMPPVHVDILSREADGEHHERLYAKGTIPHWGKPHQGWSGDETIIIRRRRPDGSWVVTKPIQ